MYLQEWIEWQIERINTPINTQTSNEVTEILETTPFLSIKFYPPYSEERIFTGNGWFYKDLFERWEIQKRQRENFLESGYTSFYGKDGLHASGFSIIAGRFLKSFEAKNKWMPWFRAWYGRPLSSGDFNFWDQESYAIGEAIYLDENKSQIITPLYVLGKNGEGVLNEKQIEDFLLLIK